MVDDKVMAAQVIEFDGQEVETLSGDNALVMIDGKAVKINDVQVIIPDIEASNGVKHVIDAVLVPYLDRATLYTPPLVCNRVFLLIGSKLSPGLQKWSSCQSAPLIFLTKDQFFYTYGASSSFIFASTGPSPKVSSSL